MSAVKYCLILFFVLPAHAASVEVTDPEGDVQYTVADVPSDDTDLVRFAVEENGTHVSFTWEVSGDKQHDGSARMYEIHFMFREAAYRLSNRDSMLEPQAPLEPDRDSLWLYRQAAYWERAGYSGAIAVEGKVHSTEVPFDAITDANGIPLASGDTINNATIQAYRVRVTERGLSTLQVTASVEGVDRAPDTGGLDLVFDEQAAKGRLRASTPEALRWSNGLAASYLFPITLASLEGALDVTLRHTGLPGTWNITYLPEVRIPAGQAITVPVVVGVPFQHEHGRTDTFVMELSADGIVQTMQMGIHYPEIPQPAGHHPRLYLHAFHQPDVPFASTWMNARPGEDEPVAHVASHPLSVPSWGAGLNPDLQMGLHFTGENAQAKITLQTGVDLNGARVVVDIRHHYATLFSGTSPAVDMAGGQATEFEFELEWMSNQTVFPPEDGANLGTVISLEWESPPKAQVYGYVGDPIALVVSDSFIDLPLLEYHDELEGPVVGGPLSIEATSVRANPGDETGIVATMRSSDGKRTVDVSVAGLAASWVTLARDRYAVDGPVEIPMAISVPEDAVPGQTYDFFLVARDTTDQALGIQLLRIHVVDAQVEEIPDHRVLGESRDSPTVLPLVAVLLAWAISRRRV